MLKEYKLSKWEYEITKNEGEGLKGYGFHLDLYKDGKKVLSEGAFGGETMAEVAVRDFILLDEFGVERDYD